MSEENQVDMQEVDDQVLDFLSPDYDWAERLTEDGNYINDDGLEVEVCGVNPMLVDKIRTSIPEVEPPTYQVPIGPPGSEEFETHVLDQMSVETDEDQERLDRYNLLVVERDREINDRLTRLLFLKGVKFELPSNGVWMEEQLFVGIEVPDGGPALRVHYVQTELCRSVADVAGMVYAILAKSGANKEAVKSIRQTFRDAVEEVSGR